MHNIYRHGDGDHEDLTTGYPYSSRRESCQHGADPDSCPACRREAEEAAQAAEDAFLVEWDEETTTERRERAQAWIAEHHDELDGNPRMQEMVEDAVGFDLDDLNRATVLHRD